MDQEFIPRREHEEFARRMESENERIRDENARQNKRIAIIEESVKEFNKIALEIQKIATSVQQMTEEISKQGKRLENIESKPGKRWETLVGGILGAVAGAIGTFVSMMILATGGAENTATQVTALIMAGASVVAYIIGEGLTDSANVETTVEITENNGKEA